MVYGKYDGMEHCWIEKEDKLIDFTHIQFDMDEWEIQEAGDQLYNKIKDTIYKDKKGEYEGRKTMPLLYSDLSANNSFKEYLETLHSKKVEDVLYQSIANGEVL